MSGLGEPISTQEDHIGADLVGAGCVFHVTAREIGFTRLFRFLLFSGATQRAEESLAGFLAPSALGIPAQILFPALLQMGDVSFLSIGLSKRHQSVFLLGLRNAGRDGGLQQRNG